jgi:anti-sigma B factor antagonist
LTKYQTHNANGITLIEFQGRLVLGDGCGTLQALLVKLLAEGAKTIHIDLSEVHSMDGSGIGVLVSAYKQMRRRGAELRLVRSSKTVCRLLHLTRLNKVLSIQGIKEEQYDVFPPKCQLHRPTLKLRRPSFAVAR